MTTKSSAFISFIEMVNAKGSIKEAIAKAQAQYCLKAHKISEITAQQSIKLYESIYLKFYKGNSQVVSSNWYQNELRIFVWTLICYIYVYQRRIEDLGQQDWNFFSTIFDRKDPKLFEYQSQAISSTLKGKNWQKFQDEYLNKIMLNRTNRTKWNEVSKQLFQISNKTCFRTAKQCRERWNNHLDPSKIKGYWKAQECLLMFEYVRQHGKKWASVVKILNETRNEHSIKNKFNSIIKKHRKQYKTQNQTEMFQEIIGRIKKTIQNKLMYQNADVSFELEQLNQSLNQSEKEGEILTCHSATQNFLRILKNFNTSQNPARSRQKQQQQSCRLIKNRIQQQKYKYNLHHLEKNQHSSNCLTYIKQGKTDFDALNFPKNQDRYENEHRLNFLGNLAYFPQPQYTLQNGLQYRPQHFFYPGNFTNKGQ